MKNNTQISKSNKSLPAKGENTKKQHGGKRDNAGRQKSIEIALKYYENGLVKEAVKEILGRSIRDVTIDYKHTFIVENFILPELQKNGQFYKEQNTLTPYWFDRTTKILYQIQSTPNMESEFDIYLNDMFGVNDGGTTKYVLKDLITEAKKRGMITSVHEFSYFDSDKCVLYVNRFDNQVYRLDGVKIELCDNVTDGVLFLHKNYIPFEYIERCKPKLFEKYLVDDISFERNGRLTPNDMKKMFSYFITSIHFHSMLKTRPINIFTGEKGSGKSVNLKRILWLLKGRGEGLSNMPKKQRDFEVQLTQNLLVFYDNVDEHVEGWFKDGLASAATTYNVQMAKLFQTNVIAEFPAKPFLGLCTRTMLFATNRDDILDRSLIYKVKPIDDYKDEGEIFNTIIKNRNEIMSSLMLEWNSIITSLIKVKNKPFATKFRMADFAKFVFGAKPDEWHKNKRIFEKLKDYQSDIAAEGSALYGYIVEYLESSEYVDSLDGHLGKIYKDLQNFHNANKIWKRPYFTKQFNAQKSNLKKWFDYDEVDENPGGKKQKLHITIKLKNDD